MLVSKVDFSLGLLSQALNATRLGWCQHSLPELSDKQRCILLASLTCRRTYMKQGVFAHD